MAKDYYATLGVGKSATDAEIKTAFRKLAHEHHPDKTGGSADKFKEINEAYQVLGNKDKRAQYDQFGSAFEGGGAGAPGGGFSWQDMYQGGSPFGGFGGAANGQQFDFGDLGDVIGDMFGFNTGAARARNGGGQRGQDMEVVIPITFLESYMGAEKEVTIRADVTCHTCQGSGGDPGANVATCSQCQGSGVVTTTRSTFLGAFATQAVCPTCNGRGSKPDKVCSACKGKTTETQELKIRVSIPGGIDETTTLRLSGKGAAGRYRAPAGDLYVRVTITSDPAFQREGADIKSREEVPLSILIAGGTLQARTPTGLVKVKIPSHTSSGKVFALRGKGFEKLRGRGRGDHLITVHARVPERITSKQRKLLEEFENSLN